MVEWTDSIHRQTDRHFRYIINVLVFFEMFSIKLLLKWHLVKAVRWVINFNKKTLYGAVNDNAFHIEMSQLILIISIISISLFIHVYYCLISFINSIRYLEKTAVECCGMKNV